MREFHDLIDRCRCEAGLSWNQLRIRAGLDRQTIYRYRSGQGGISAASLAKIFRVLGIEAKKKKKSP